MVSRPVSVRVPCVNDVERRRERPTSLLIHEKRDVLGVVVLISRQNIENHAAKLLSEIIVRETQGVHDVECLLIAMGTGQLIIQVRDREQRLHMDLLATCSAVKSLRHEVTTTTFIQQLARRHFDPGGFGHERVRILNFSESLGIANTMFAIRDAVEFQYPVFEARRRIDLPRSHFIGVRIPGDDGFCSGAAGGGANTKYFIEGLGIVLFAGGEPDLETVSQVKNVLGKLGKRGNLNGNTSASGIRVLDFSESLGIANTMFAIRDTVEFQYPVFEARRRIDLPRSHFIGVRIPGDDGFCSGAAGGGANTKYFIEGLGIVLFAGGEPDLETVSQVKNVLGKLGKRGNLNGNTSASGISNRGTKFQRSHATLTDIAEAFNRTKGRSIATLTS